MFWNICYGSKSIWFEMTNVEIKTVLDLQHKFMYKTHFIFHLHAPKKPASAHLRVLE